MTHVEEARWAVILDFIEAQGGDPLFGRGKIVVFTCDNSEHDFIGKIAYRRGREVLFSLFKELVPFDEDTAEDEEFEDLVREAFDNSDGKASEAGKNGLFLDVNYLYPLPKSILALLPKSWFENDEDDDR